MCEDKACLYMISTWFHCAYLYFIKDLRFIHLFHTCHILYVFDDCDMIGNNCEKNK